MTALNDSERAVHNRTSARPDRPAPTRPTRWRRPPHSARAGITPRGCHLVASSPRSSQSVVCSCWRPLTAPPSPSSRFLRFAERLACPTPAVAGDYLLIRAASGGLSLLGDRLGDTIGRKRTFIVERRRRQSLGGPLALAVIQAVITSRTLYLGGTNGPVMHASDAQSQALDHGYTYGLLWVAGAAIIVGGAALFIGYTPEQVAHAQEVKEAIDAGEL